MPQAVPFTNDLLPKNENAPSVRVAAVSIAAPAFNEAAGIEAVVRSWLDHLSNYPGLEDFEIVVCNDGSADNTGPILRKLAASDARVRPVEHAVNRGAAAALRTAMGHTRLPWVLIMDADGQYGVENLGLLIRSVESSGGRGAVGVRRSKRDSTFNRIGSRLSCALCNWIHGTRYRDFFCSFMLVEGALLRSLQLEARGLNYSGDIASKLAESGIRLSEVGIEHKARTSGRSSAHSLRAALDRFLFVAYLGFRQFLLRHKVLERRVL